MSKTLSFASVNELGALTFLSNTKEEIVSTLFLNTATLPGYSLKISLNIVRGAGTYERRI